MDSFRDRLIGCSEADDLLASLKDFPQMHFAPALYVLRVINSETLLAKKFLVKSAKYFATREADQLQPFKGKSCDFPSVSCRACNIVS